MTHPPIRVLDTGTRAATVDIPSLQVHHQPALVRRALPIDDPQILPAVEVSHHLIYYSQFAAKTTCDLDLPWSTHRLWAVGDRTARWLRDHHDLSIDTPDQQTFQGLRNALKHSSDPRPIIAFGLADSHRDLGPIARDWDVAFTDIPVYESAPCDGDEFSAVFNELSPQWLTLTSSRGVRSVIDALGAARLQQLHRRQALRLAAIGPSTARTAREFGLSPQVVLATPDRDQLLIAIADHRSTSHSDHDHLS